jgi:GAF domain-containing protein
MTETPNYPANHPRQIIAELQRKLNERTAERDEATSQQAATADILKVISRSAFDLQRVLDALVESVAKLCDTDRAVLIQKQGDQYYRVALQGFPANAIAEMKGVPVDLKGGSIVARALRNCTAVHVADVNADPEYPGTPAQSLGGVRTVLSVPLVRETQPVGAITVSRIRVEPFTEKQIDLIKIFADQAVIAIENARLIDEVQAKTRDLTEALTYQTGSSNILGVIASSPTDVAPVLKAIADSACELCEAYDALVHLREGNHLRYCAHHGPIPFGFEKRPTGGEPIPFGSEKLPINRNWVTGRSVVDKVPVHVHDVLSAEGADFPEAQRLSSREGTRTILSVPLLRDNESIGAIVLRRTEVRPFSDKQIALLQTFADQAVIAIGNVRLFNETQDALERQTATADILKVIASSPTNIQPVFDAIAERSNRLIGGHATAVYRFVGEIVQLEAFTPVSAEADAALKASYPRPISGESQFELVREGKIAQIADTDSENVAAITTATARARGWRSVIFMPLTGDAGVIGAITVTRKEAGAFADHHVRLLQTFADQALIAIENARLFNETQETLERQTATADILKVIASSPTDVQPVFDAIAASANRLLGGFSTAVFRFVDDIAHLAAFTPTTPPADKVLQSSFPMPLANFEQFELAKNGQPVQTPDIEQMSNRRIREIARMRGFRSMLFVPLMNSGIPIGIISVTRLETGSFGDHHVQLLQTFADQAVIAIENVRLFEAVQTKTRHLEEALQIQTATSEVLKVISRSPDALQPVLDAIAKTACELCGSDGVTIFLLRDEKFHFTAVSGTVPKHLEYLRANPTATDEPTSVFGQLMLKKRTIHYANVFDHPELDQNRIRLGGERALLMVPLLRDDQMLGVIVLRQSHMRPFTPPQIQAIEVFADQAVIAISNVGLFEQVQRRTFELSQSLDELRAAQDRLIQTEKLASLGQLTAGIAHEIKNPLNFVNNFAALTADLTDELKGVLRSAALGDGIREETDDLTRIMKDNLEKIVQHGKRADSIVKNMLLHSREGSGEHRPVEINAILDESLNLAYHGARAEKPGFSITLQRDFDPATGMADVYPQEITRVLLNLISNGFYAASRRAAETGEGFEPALRAATKNLGDKIEIRIRDNGIGIAPEVKEKIFNPFFTTKPAGEGTGLGLSMSHDIVVKQHGGTIDVDTEPGIFTEFIITLPRTIVSRKTAGGTN